MFRTGADFFQHFLQLLFPQISVDKLPQEILESSLASSVPFYFYFDLLTKNRNRDSLQNQTKNRTKDSDFIQKTLVNSEQ